MKSLKLCITSYDGWMDGQLNNYIIYYLLYMITGQGMACNLLTCLNVV